MSHAQSNQTSQDAKQTHSWELLARASPLWAVCTNGKRRMDWDPDAFMATGEKEVAWAFGEAKKAGVLPKDLHAAVDFGCGPGRLSGALARRTGKVVGVDASPTMLELARQNHPGAAFRFLPDLRHVPDTSADLAYSTFVFQHLSEAQMHRSMSELMRILRPGGVLIFQYPSAPRPTIGGLGWRVLPPRVILFVQHRLLGSPQPIPMSWAGPADIAGKLEALGFALAVHSTGPRYSPNWHDVWYFATKPNQPARLST